MSNLSELLPTGGGQNAVDFVASGTLSSGQTVALKADGTVEAVAAGGPESAAPVSFSASSISVTPGSAYHATANKVIVFYRNTVSTYPTAVVGTVSGTAISFGSEIAIGTRINPLGTAVVYDSANDKLVFCVASGGFVYAYVGTLSGTSISIGSEANVSYGGSSAPLLGAVYDINSGKTVVTAQRGDNTYAQSVVLTVSGTTPSFGTAVVANSAASYDITSVYDENAQKVGVFYRVGGTFYGKVGTVSGTSISFGTQSSGISGTPAYADSCYDSNTQKIVIVYSLNALTNRPYCVVATISGTTLTFGTNVEINTVRADSNAISYDSTAQKVVITNYVYNASPQVTVGTVSGTSISYGTTNTLATSTGLSLPLKSVYDPSADKTIISTQVSTVSGASSVVFSTSSTNSADFLGITDQAIADTATGAVIVQGGVSEKLSGLTVGADYYVQADGSIASGSIPYDISSASFDSVTFSFASQNVTPRGFAFNSDGTKMYQAAYSGTIYQYTLSTGYDLSTASYSTSASFTSQSTSITNFAFSSDGAKLYIISYTDKTVYQYSLSTAYDVTTASYDSLSFSVNSQETDPYAITISSDGTKFFVVGTSGDDVNEYTLSTAYNISTASFVDSFSTQPQEYNPYGIYFNSDGTYMFIVGNDDNVNQYTLQTGFDVSTASHTFTFSVASQELTSNGIAFNSDGTKMYVSGYASDNVNQYSTTPASTTVPAGRALSTTSILLEG